MGKGNTASVKIRFKSTSGTIIMDDTISDDCVS